MNELTPLSKTMSGLLGYIKENGGKIKRYPGGYWTSKNWGTVLVAAKGVMHYIAAKGF